MDVTFDKKAGTLTIVVPVKKPLKESASGKSKIVYSSKGNVETDVKIEGHNVKIGLNAYIPNEEA